MFSAFIVALFTEMYGFPLTVYLLSGWLTNQYPDIDIFSHEHVHLWHTLLGLSGDAHFDFLYILSIVLIIAGFWVLSSAWKVLYAAQNNPDLDCDTEDCTLHMNNLNNHPQLIDSVSGPFTKNKAEKSFLTFTPHIEHSLRQTSPIVLAHYQMPDNALQHPLQKTTIQLK